MSLPTDLPPLGMAAMAIEPHSARRAREVPLHLLGAANATAQTARHHLPSTALEQPPSQPASTAAMQRT
eukprot:CAMPEP_0115737624 /NCGR_PEP_ID=MMETSP0272-20121206/87920_1 /TAXON_ID=71861 /ORGANISM="Scrippsiella trochoidea, Strain CCMP3099" /LENGTH=68 /DNA_ID=CAMNT_0003181945 /DNA_START=26 /DNA_END=228 /DNA_ORIENTATION=+